MTKCEHCEIVDRNTKAEILYEDSEVIIAVKDVVAIPGQITVFPREHFTIMEMVPNNLLKKLAVMANKVGAAVFDALGAQGTNIIVQNGLGAGQKVPHFAIEVLPRREADGINLQWQPKQLAEDEVAMVFNLLKEEMRKADFFKDEKKGKKSKELTVKDEKTKTEMKVEKKDEDNYLLKSLKRIP